MVAGLAACTRCPRASARGVLGDGAHRWTRSPRRKPGDSVGIHVFQLICALLALTAAVARGEESKPITYEDHVAGILKKHCATCHGDGKQEGGLSLVNYAGVLKGAGGGEIVAAGRSGSSRLIEVITAPDDGDRMPPEGERVPADQVALIKTWIGTGLRENAGSSIAEMRTLGFKPAAPQQAASGPPPVPQPDKLLAAGGKPVQNGAAVLFDVATGKRLASVGDESDAVMAADLSPDESQIAIGGSSRIVKIFSTETGKLLHTLTKHTDWVTAVAFSPDGKLLATGDRIGNIHLWDAKSGGVVLPLSEHKKSVRALSWRSDSGVVASCGEDGTIVWWDVKDGWPVMNKPNAHGGGVLDVVFGPAGELASCGRDGQAKLWAADGKELKSFPIADGQTKAPPRREAPAHAGRPLSRRLLPAGRRLGRPAPRLAQEVALAASPGSRRGLVWDQYKP